MKERQLDAVLEYLNDEEGIVTLEDVRLAAINEGIVDKLKKTVSGFKPVTKSLFGGLFKKKTIDVQQVITDFDLEKVEGKNDLYICHKYKVLGQDPYIHIPLAMIAQFPNNLRLFLQWSDEAKWENIFNNSFAARANIDYTDVESDVKNKKLVAVYTTKGIEGQYMVYRTYAIYSIKSKTLKNAKYHTCTYAFDGYYEYSGWSQSDPSTFGLEDLVK